MGNREKYEQLILSSPLFSLDKERDRTAYRREAYKMVEYLYNYLLAVNKNRYIDYGLEITETANRCIENYSAEMGSFLHYFNATMAKEYRRARVKRNMQETRSGLHISEEDERNIRRMLRFMESKGIADPTDEQIQSIAKALDVPPETVKKTLITVRETTVVPDITTGEDGEEISLFDTVASDYGQNGDMMDKEACAALLSHIENVFRACQERQKPILSAILTARICEIVCSGNVSVERYSFLDREMIGIYIQNGFLPTQRDIAFRFGKNEASVSRTVREFVEKLAHKTH